MMGRSIEKGRRGLRKRTHLRLLCCTFMAILVAVFIVLRLYTYHYLGVEYNSILQRMKRVKKLGKTSLLFVGKTDYIFADEQPDYSEIVAKRSSLPVNKTIPKIIANNTGIVKYNNDNILEYEHDPTIEENALPETYKWHVNKPRSTKCSITNPAKHVVLLRSHRTGSQTVGNIFYRYGDFNNLMFALPKSTDFEYYWPLRFHHTRVDKSLLGKDPPNFLINTARNSRIKIKSFLSSETYKVAIMRDPVSHLQSVYASIGMPYLMKHITNSSEHFGLFAEDPRRNLEKIMNKTKLFDPVFNLLHNGQLFDFGYNMEDYTNPIDLQFVIHELDEYIDLILISEYMDESLVLLQRMLCWQLADVVYIKKRWRRHQINITEKQKQSIRDWNKLDTQLYNYFNNSLWRKLSEQNDSFWKDVKKLKEMNNNLHSECVDQTNNITNGTSAEGDEEKKASLHIKYSSVGEKDTRKNSQLTFSKKDSFEVVHVIKDIIDPSIRHICERLLLSEKEYIQFLKLKQKEMMERTESELLSKMLFRNSTEGQFYYDFLNNIVHNNTEGVNVDKQPHEDIEEAKEITLGLSHID